VPVLEGYSLLWSEFADQVEGEVIALVLGEGVYGMRPTRPAGVSGARPW